MWVWMDGWMDGWDRWMAGTGRHDDEAIALPCAYETATSICPGLASQKWFRFCWNVSLAGAPAM